MHGPNAVLRMPLTYATRQLMRTDGLHPFIAASGSLRSMALAPGAQRSALASRARRFHFQKDGLAGSTDGARRHGNARTGGGTICIGDLARRQSR